MGSRQKEAEGGDHNVISLPIYQAGALPSLPLPSPQPGQGTWLPSVGGKGKMGQVPSGFRGLDLCCPAVCCTSHQSFAV